MIATDGGRDIGVHHDDTYSHRRIVIGSFRREIQSQGNHRTPLKIQ